MEYTFEYHFKNEKYIYGITWWTKNQY